MPEITGSGLTAPIAYRWKTQFNENAKSPAFAGELPEIDHNEIVGWKRTPGLGRFAAVFLDDCDLHPRVRTRIALTRELIAEGAAASTSGWRAWGRPGPSGWSRWCCWGISSPCTGRSWMGWIPRRSTCWSS